MITIYPGKVYGTVTAPSSKSCFQRMLAIASLSKSDSTIRYSTTCNDVDVAIDIVANLGYNVEHKANTLIIRPEHSLPTQTIHCGESGLLARMFAPICALLDKNITLLGTGTLLKRDMSMIGSALQQLQVRIQSQNERLPIIISGPIVGGKTIQIDGSSGSQLLTGLLIVLPMVNVGKTIINVINLKSIPYIDLTIDILKQQGIAIENNQYTTFTIPGQQKIAPINTTIESDWSGASFLFIAGAIAGSVTVKGINPESKQADKAILNALSDCGADVSIADDQISIQKNKLSSFNFDATHCPDLFPPLVVLAAYCTGESRIKGVSRLTDKESNRSYTLSSTFNKLGVPIYIDGDEMIIKGSPIKGCTVSSHHDHRIAMAVAIAALGADSPIAIQHPEAVNKSYPTFFKDLFNIKKN